jgi:hypothetical protein
MTKRNIGTGSFGKGSYRTKNYKLPKCLKTWDVQLVTAIARLVPYVYNTKKGTKADYNKLYSVINIELEKAGVQPTNGKTYGRRFSIFHVLRALYESCYAPYMDICYNNLIEIVTGLCIEQLYILDGEVERRAA